jgi:hypothetical protein
MSGYGRRGDLLSHIRLPLAAKEGLRLGHLMKRR